MRVAEAVDQAQQAVLLDPLSPSAHGFLGLVLVVAREFDRACEAGRTAVQLAPGLWWLRWFYGTALLMKDPEEGVRQCLQVYEQVHQPVVVGAMALVCGLTSQPDRAREFLQELEGIAETTPVTPQAFALAYLGVGDDRVFEWLERAITARDPVATHLPSMPFYDGIRHDPRFAGLLARMGLG